MLNTALIKRRMTELGIDQQKLADLMGVKRPTVSQKINNIRRTSLDEAEILAQVLEIPNEQFGSYFFAR